MSNPNLDLSRLQIDRSAPPEVRSAFRRNLILVGAVLVLFVGTMFALRRGHAVPVQAVVVQASSGSAGPAAAAGAIVVTANGYVVARTRASVSSKVPGRLASLAVDEGSNVREGQVIAHLENADYAAAVAQQRAEVAASEAELAAVVVERDQARREFVRIQDIRATNANLVSEQDVEAAKSRLDEAEARATAAEARIAAARAGVRYAEANLENTYIRAPFTGTVLRKDAEVGEVVAPSVGGGLTRGAVVTMADLRTLEVEVDVNEAYIGRVHRGQEARIVLDAYPDTSFRGSVRQVVPTADRQRATVQVKVSILDRDARILPEMGARVDFVAEAPKPAAGSEAPAAAAPQVFRLPASAVYDSGGATIVWLIRDNRLEPRTVVAGPVSADYREIRSGLLGGELVLTGGVAEPKAGLKVEVSSR